MDLLTISKLIAKPSVLHTPVVYESLSTQFVLVPISSSLQINSLVAEVLPVRHSSITGCKLARKLMSIANQFVTCHWRISLDSVTLEALLRHLFWDSWM